MTTLQGLYCDCCGSRAIFSRESIMIALRQGTPLVCNMCVLKHGKRVNSIVCRKEV